MARGPNADDNRSPDSIVDEIEVTRDRLAGTIDQIVDRANPKNAARRAALRVKARFIAADGSPRTENIVPVAGALAGAIVLILLIRQVVGRD